MSNDEKPLPACPHCGAKHWKEKLWAWVCINCGKCIDKSGVE